MTKEDYTAARRAIGTQEEVSEKLGIHRTTLAQRERGYTEISKEMELAIRAIENTLPVLMNKPREFVPFADTGKLEDAETNALVPIAIEIIRQEQRATTSLIQRRLKLGYTRACRIMEELERRGIVGPGEGAHPRQILIALEPEEKS